MNSKVNVYPRFSVNGFYSAFVKEYDAGFHFQGESHDLWELACILSGEAGITSGTRLYECQAWDVMIHPPGIFHSMWSKNNEKVKFLTIGFVGEGLTGMVPRGKFILTESEKQLVALLREKLEQCGTGEDLHEGDIGAEDAQIIKNLLEVLVLSLYNRCRETAETASGRDTAQFAAIAGYLKQHLCEPLDVSRICQDCSIGKSTLKTLFRRYTGLGVMKYYNYLRIQNAVKLLGQGLSMAEIAETMGFSSQNYFSTFFKRETGVSPSQYKTK